MAEKKRNSDTMSGEDFDLREEITTHWKGKLIPADDKWFLEDQTINFQNLIRFATLGFVRRLKVLLAYRSMRYAAGTIGGDFNRILHVARFLGRNGFPDIDVLTEEHLMVWMATLIKEGLNNAIMRAV